MKTTERPILFSTAMVQAILAGQKTQTRRIIKANISNYYFQSLVLHASSRYTFAPNGKYPVVDADIIEVKYPYGKPGDVLWGVGMNLWVRETWHPKRHSFPIGLPYEYKATAEEDGTPTDEGWKPSIFMPKAACRIKLEITNIRVERVQDISEEDAMAEGVGSGFQMNAGWPDYEHIKNGVCTLTQDTAKMSFASLWDSINKKRGYGWGKNSWVWVIEFKRT